jgi:hypothetical protein
LGAVMQAGSVVLGVKPAFEDVDAQIFLAFHCALAEDQIEPNYFFQTA